MCDRNWGSFHGMPGELKDDPLTIVVGVRDARYSKDTCGICAKGEEGSAKGRKEHGDEGGGWRGEPNEGTVGGWRGDSEVLNNAHSGSPHALVCRRV